MIRHLRSNNKAMTLAEVFITLTIIGVVAAMTITALYNDASNLEHQSGLKKADAELAQVTSTISNQNGDSMTNLCNGDENSDSANNCLKNIYQQYFNISSTCDINNPGDYPNACWNISANIFDGSAAYAAPVSDGPSGFVTADGMSYSFQYFSKDCSDYRFGSTPACGEIDVDVDGPNKGPNKIGIDQFIFRITPNGIMPLGSLGDNYANTSAGLTAAVVVNPADGMAAVGAGHPATGTTGSCSFNGDGTFTCN